MELIKEEYRRQVDHKEAQPSDDLFTSGSQLLVCECLTG